jgi:hypothetical protein
LSITDLHYHSVLGHHREIIRQATFNRSEEEKIQAQIQALEQTIKAQLESLHNQASSLDLTTCTLDRTLTVMNGETRFLLGPIAQDECHNISDMIVQKLPRELPDGIYQYLLLRRTVRRGGDSWTVHESHPGICCLVFCSSADPDDACMCKAHIWDVEYMGTVVRHELAHQWYKLTNFIIDGRLTTNIFDNTTGTQTRHWAQTR